MKLFVSRLFTSVAIVVVWRLLLQLLLAYFSGQPQDIQFPYYDTDLIPYYSRLQSVWAHFDGVHYLRLAARGYQDTGTQAFFPLYPLLIRALTPLFPSPLFAATALSLTALTFALTGLLYLFPPRNSKFIILHSLFFPTSFFFAAAYTESLFLALTVWFFYFLTSGRYLLAACLAALASATRLTGIILAISLLVHFLHRRPRPALFFLLLVAAGGFLAYSFFLWSRFQDPLLYFHVQPLFGAERSGTELILLPQVLWRYLKIIVTVNPATWLAQRAALELGVFILAVATIIRRWHRYPLELSAYLSFSLLLPTLTGSLSSLPRYLLVLVPWLMPTRRSFLVIYFACSLPLLIYLFAFFAQGWFVA